MRTLRLVALSDDGKSLILAADAPDSEGGERFELPIDDRVRAAARGDTRRLGQIDVDLGNHLPPRVIQARIRAGETPEQVAAASGTRVERIMRFAHPVLQERERVAEQAQEARVRLSEGTPTTALARFMVERLRLIDSDIEAVEWDAYRSDEGVWIVSAGWRAGGQSGTTRWSFDIPARVVSPLDAATLDFAEGTRLVRVVPDVPHGDPAPAPRRSVAVLRENLRRDRPPAPPEDEDVVQDVTPVNGVPVALDLPHEASLDGALDGALGGVLDGGDTVAEPPREQPLPEEQALLDEIAEHDTVVLGRNAEDSETDDPRARIPAWEDIVFGVRRHR